MSRILSWISGGLNVLKLVTEQISIYEAEQSALTLVWSSLPVYTYGLWGQYDPKTL